MNARHAAAAVAATVILSACDKASDSDPRMVSEWVHTLYGAIRVERLSPPVASRLLGYTTTALYSGLAVSKPDLPSLAGVLNGLPALPQPDSGQRYDGTLAAVAAVRVVLDSLLHEGLPTTRGAFARLADSLEQARVALGIGDAVRSRSSDLGRQLGIAIVAWSRADGFDSTRGRPYVPPTGSGLWVNDAPANTYATQNMSGASEFVALDNPANLLRPGNQSDRGLILSRPKRAGLKTLPPVNITGTSEPYWGQVRPFVLSRWNECAVPPPPAYSTDRSSTLYKDAAVVHETRKKLTPEQRTIALYWAEDRKSVV